MNKKIDVNKFIRKHNLKPAFDVDPSKTKEFLKEMANPTITAEEVIARNEAKLEELKERKRKFRNVKKPRRPFVISEEKLNEIINNPNRRTADQVIEDFDKELKEMMEKYK